MTTDDLKNGQATSKSNRSAWRWIIGSIDEQMERRGKSKSITIRQTKII